MTRAVRVALLTVVVGVVVAAGAALWMGKPWAASQRDGEAQPGPQSGSQPFVTTFAELGTLASSMKLVGRVSFGEPVALPPTEGILTVLPQAGAELGLGQFVYEEEGKPVVLMVGSRPFWRELSLGVTDGEDVRQLQQNLADMGYYTAYVGDKFDEYTRDAIKEWQEDLGVEQTGVFSPGDAVVTATAPVRVDRVTGTLGLSGTSPATYTSAQRRVSAFLSDRELSEVEIGQEVQVTAADGTTFPGVIADITDAQPAAGEQEEVKPKAIIDLLESADSLSGDVRVTLVKESEGDVLLVPVSALVVLPNGQYAVEVLREGEPTPARIPVEVGRVSQAKAEITGGDLNSGDEVVVTR